MQGRPPISAGAHIHEKVVNIAAELNMRFWVSVRTCNVVYIYATSD